MANVLTALRGDAVLNVRWMEAYKASGVKDRAIVAVNNLEDEEFVKASGNVAIMVAPFPGGDEQARVDYIAAVYETLIRASKTEWVIIWDDDILPPVGDVNKLVWAARKVDDQAAGVVTIYPYVNNTVPGFFCLFWRPYSFSISESGVPASGVHKVWGGGTGLSIWRRAVLLETTPWHSEIVGGSAQGWDRDLAIKLENMGLNTLAECSIRSRHDTLP